MGLHDRPYYQDSYSSPWQSSGGFGVNRRSIIISLMIVNVAIFVLDMFSPAIGEQSRWLSNFLALKPADLYTGPWNVIKFLTCGFAHAPINSKESFFHVGGNMLVLFFLGKPIEERLGRAEFLKFYLAAVIVASLGYFLLNTGSSVAMLGASGAVSAVVALFVFFYPNSTLHLFGVLPIKTWILGVFIVGMDLLRSLSPESHVAWEAHLAGFGFGFLYFKLKWSFERFSFGFLTQPFKNRAKLKLHAPDQLQEQADAILQKINEQGEESLTAKERRILKKYSKQIRNRQS